MTTTPTTNLRILSIAPSFKGVGFAVLEGRDTLIDWGVKAAVGKGNKNAKSLAKVEKLITRYRPDMLVLEDVLAEGSQRYPRIRRLLPQVIKLAQAYKVKSRLFSRQQVMKSLIPDGTRHALAVIIARRFPEQLGSKLPPKRKVSMNEHPRMSVFDAVALAETCRLEIMQRNGYQLR